MNHEDKRHPILAGSYAASPNRALPLAALRFRSYRRKSDNLGRMNHEDKRKPVLAGYSAATPNRAHLLAVRRRSVRMPEDFVLGINEEWRPARPRHSVICRLKRFQGEKAASKE
jgi:hypothetical protein